MSRPSDTLIDALQHGGKSRGCGDQCPGPDACGSLAPMRIGLALPQYDYSVAGERPLQFDTIVDYARLAERGGAESVWLSDHLFLDLAKYGGSARARGLLRPDRHARRARPRGAPGAARDARAARGACARPRCWPRRWRRSTA